MYRASDGLPVRASGAWAQEKLHYVDAYMSIFNKGMKTHFPHRVYLDLMAGPGRGVVRGTTEVFEGSPLLAAEQEPGFERILCVEINKTLASALERRLAGNKRVTVICGDCNAQEIVAELHRIVVTTAGLGLAFIDLLGLNVAFNTIRVLTAGGVRLDLLITFQVSDIQRNVDAAMANDPLHAPRFDRFFGTRAWRQVVRDFEQGRREAPDVTSALTDFYGKRLQSIGYEHVAQLHRLIRNTVNAPLYRLILAGRHERATEFFRKISKIEYSGQRSLLD